MYLILVFICFNHQFSGPLLKQFTDAREPTQLETLQYFFFKHKSKTVAESSVQTAKAVVEIWHRLNKQPQDTYLIGKKVKNLYEEYMKLKKYRKTETAFVNKKRAQYINILASTTFDVSKDVSRMRRTDQVECISGQNDQIEGGSGRNTGENSNTLVIREEQPGRRATEQIAGTSGQHVDILMNGQATGSADQIDDESDSNASETIRDRSLRKRRFDQNGDPGVNFDDDIVQDQQPKIRPNKDTCAAFDRCGVSSQEGNFLFLTIASNLGHDLNNSVCSTSTVHRLRTKYREESANSIRNEFQPVANTTLHFDGKRFNGEHRGTYDKRIGVVLSHNRNFKILGIPSTPNGCGKTIADVVYDEVTEWGAQDYVCALSFDTENANTGRGKGAAKFLQLKFGRELLHLACRRHIFEITISGVFAVTVELHGTDAPTIYLFEYLCGVYNRPAFRKDQYSGIAGDAFFDAFISEEEQQEIIVFCYTQLAGFQHTRSDYLELLKLIIILLTDGACEFSVYAPGAYTRARFMGRIIYSTKIYLYRDQLGLSEEELDGIRRFLLFVLKAYLKYWYKGCIAVAAPKNDLEFLKRLLHLREAMPISSTEAIKKFQNHLWYLSETLAPLSFFDDEVSVENKRRMVENLDRPENKNNTTRFSLTSPNSIEDLTLASFITRRALQFFDICRINTDFLAFDPAEWENQQSYTEGKSICSALTVVNDAAERTIGLYKDYHSHAKTDEQREYIFQVVEKSRKDYKKLTKRTIVDKLAE